jgi:hypothetical protein
VFDGNADVVQLVQARYQDRHQMFQSIIQSRPDRFSIVLTVPSGPRIMRIDWMAGRISEQRDPIAPEALSAERMLADLMLVYATTAELRAALQGASVIEGPGAQRRIVKDGHDVVVTRRPVGDPWSGPASLNNLVFDYALSIQSQREQP